MAKLKAAVIGTGGISNEHIGAYLKNENVELYAFCDINEKQLKLMAEKYGVPEERCFLDKDEMLKALPEIDIVSVCTWNSAHAECTIAALNAGKNVLCEKPMAMNTAEAEKMLEAAKKNNKLLQIGFVRRYGNDADVMKDFIDAGYFGDIYYAKATYLRRHGNPGAWFCNKELSGGGPVIDLGVHVIDLTRYLMGNPKPVSVYAVTQDKIGGRTHLKTDVDWKSEDARDDEPYTVEDFATAIIRYDNGSTTLLETSYSLNGESTIKKEFFGDKGGIKIDEDGFKLYTEMNGFMVDVDPKLSKYKLTGT